MYNNNIHLYPSNCGYSDPLLCNFFYTNEIKCPLRKKEIARVSHQHATSPGQKVGLANTRVTNQYHLLHELRQRIRDTLKILTLEYKVVAIATSSAVLGKSILRSLVFPSARTCFCAPYRQTSLSPRP